MAIQWASVSDGVQSHGGGQGCRGEEAQTGQAKCRPVEDDGHGAQNGHI